MLRLRRIRQKKEITLTRLAVLAKIDPGTLSRLERGLLPAYPGWRKRIASALGVPEEELFQTEEGSEVN